LIAHLKLLVALLAEFFLLQLFAQLGLLHLLGALLIKPGFLNGYLVHTLLGGLLTLKFLI